MPISSEESQPMKTISARCGHVKRRLNRNEPLTGALLEFALDVVGDGEVSGDDGFSGMLRSIASKLKAGEQLSEYEHHIMVDVLLLHTRLGSGAR